jgi:Flp pilus assembly protein TadD
MNSTDPRPSDEQLAALLAAAEKDAPPPDAAFLERLRARSLEAFQAACQQAPSPRKRTMILSSLRWAAAAAAVVLVLGALGLALAHWIAQVKGPQEKFVVGDTLTEDGRIGKVTDAQGVVSVKPVLHERWSPVQPRLVLKPGDWLRTDARGANAVAVQLINATGLIVGPHSTVELVKPTEVRLVEGEVEITAADNAPVELHGPDRQQVRVKGRQHFRVEKEKLVAVEEEPLWLKGFKGTTANESIGSLIATVDGRDVPLTVGYHHVTVDIRDQIARTVIEESFVNRSPAVLEGVFHFPLPQDASISGFGMWVGDQLVDADIVEKQRAREIYEIILREKRDPGLLEWSGGNIFKARVYPIPANSEKRIKITYTQVLPLRGNRYRYSYALHSELLRQHPLRDLAIDLKVNSAIPLKSVSSPTHAARIDRTEHSGHVEFTAQEYTPTRDFEAVIEVDRRQSDVVVIPHRRGDVGYFMVQLTPPGAAGDQERPLIPDGAPLHLLLLIDTSASMDQGQRATQNAVLGSLLGALTPKDTVDIAACDVNCDWLFEKPVAATPAHISTIREVLAKRKSLGWTDLDKAFAAALARSAPGTHVIYLGDGIVTTGDADPVAFAKRLRRLFEGKAGTCHAVTVGSSYEPAVLEAIASLGGGSVRHVSGEQGPQAVALELLSEINTPALRDLTVEFRGLRTARVYPEKLPNVPAGSQQILLGRYLPEGKDQTGEVVVSGTLGDKPVRFTSKVVLADAEQGNSFIPRLWARMHLDRLLEQGSSDTVKQDIIALSEEYQIITPYTSFLVLESDADRERFAVKRGFRMRDGEKFFAEGRDNASLELLQKQMKRAGDWRTALRRQVLAQLMTLGRDARLFRPPAPNRRMNLLSSSEVDENTPLSSGGVAGVPFSNRLFKSSDLGSLYPAGELGDEFSYINYTIDSELRDFAGLERNKSEGKRLEDALPPATPEPVSEMGLPGGAPVSGRMGNDAFVWGGGGGGFGPDGLDLDGSEIDRKKVKEMFLGGEPALRALWDETPFGGLGGKPGYRSQPSRLQWLGSLFPSLNPPATEPKEPKSTWPAPALALSRSLLRLEKLGQQKGGLVLDRQSDGFISRQHELASRNRRLELVAPNAWLGRTTPEGGSVTVSWCDGKEIGTYTTVYFLGRVRATNRLDLQRPPLELADHSVTPLHVTFADYTPTLETPAKDQALLILKHKNRPDHETRYLIDTSRNVVLSVEQRSRGKVSSTTRFDDFVEIAGSWWARRVETLDDKGQRLALTTQTITELTADEFATRMTQELAGKGKVLFLRQPLPGLAEAKAAVAAGKATFDDQAVLTLHFATTQQWARGLEHLQQCERLAAGKQGLRWLRDAFLLASRRHEELRQRLLDEAGALATATDADTLANDYFLAEFLTGQAQQVMETNETLGLADRLEKIYQRQPEHVQALKTWRSRRVSLLQQAGQSDKALSLSRDLAVAYPHDHNLQFHYAQNLASAGDHEAAYAWLNRVLVPEAKWASSEEETLRELFARLLQQQGRYRELAGYLAGWTERNPETEQPYGQYLTALVRSNQAEKAETLAGQWLRDAQVAGELPGPAAARLRAAVAFALGQRYNLNTNRIDERWHAPLAGAALFFARHDEHLETAANILQHWRFQGTDAAREVRQKLAAILVEEFDTLSAAQLGRFVDWAWSDPSIERDARKRIAEGLRKRWDAEEKPPTRHDLAQPLVRILSWLGPEEVLPFLRVQWQHGPEPYRVQYVNQLFNTLLTQTWSAEFEDEAFALLDKLSQPDEPANGLFTRVAALHRLTDAMLEARFQARMRTVEHPEKLTRVDLQKKQDENRKLAREGFADRLQKESAKQAKPFAGWLVIERLWIETLLERDPKPIAAACWEFVAPAPAPANVKPDDEPPGVEKVLDEVLRDRFLVTLTHLAARKGADPGLVERLLNHLDQQLKAHPDDGRWRAEKYRFLIALDRPRDLEKELRQWVAGPDPDNRWRLALGYLLAEQGKVAEAIQLFEAVESADELSPAAYRSLADWYLVENRRAQHEKAQAAVYKTLDEYRLSQRVSVYLRPWQNTGGRLPTQLDPEVLQVFKVLFEKSAAPQNYLWQLQQFYQAARDFRLLAMLADGVVGHSAGKVYPFLQGMNGILGEVRDEATADELVARIAKVRPSAKTTIDQRALDLLEVLVERRAAELRNQPGPHADRALTALQRAFRRDWSPGEPRLMADFLGGLGSITQQALAKEQLRQLQVLHRDAAAGSFDRLHIARRYTETLHATSRQAEATDLLQGALDEFQNANQGRLPTSANEALTTLISFTESARHYDRGEKLLLAQLEHPIYSSQKDWLVRRLNELYLQALRNKGDVSLGNGATLYKALERKLFADLAVPDQNQRYHLLSQLCVVYRTAHPLALPGVVDDLQAAAFKRLPPILAEQVTNYDEVVRNMADTLHTVAGARPAIAFLLDRVEDEPGWLRYDNQDAWARYCHRLAEWRNEVKNLGDLEARFLKFVLAELRRDLRSREARSRTLYDRRHNYYWEQKEADFARAAEEVLAERKSPGASVEYIAEYLFHGLPREKRAIEALFAAHEQKVLAESGQWQLVDYLHRQQRFAESIPLLLPLVELRPENLGYRTKLMHAYFRTGKQGDLLTLLAQTDTFFHEKDRWNEGAIAGLAASCLENQLYPQSVAYFEELIPLHQRSHARRGVGNGILSGYYAAAARAYSGLGKTKEAVDKASGAVVSWAPGQQQRKEALEALVKVLAAAPDLDAYVAELDREKLQSAIVRKAVGQAYVRKGEPAPAIPQLQLAAELQPNDAETYQALIACYDKIGDKEGAVRQLLQAVELSRRDVKLYEQLGQRFAELRQPAEAERAYTSMVEMLPNESEGHAALAEVYEKQNRWPEAIAHWERVATIRALEPTGLLKLAEAQIHEKAWDQVAATLQTLRSQSWPQRFGDVQQQARELERKIEGREKR